MTRPKKCESCGKVRNLRGWKLCDDCTDDYWWVNGGYEWTDDMREFHWAVVSDRYHDDRVALIAEQRWSRPPARSHITPSSLWDASTPSSALVIPPMRFSQLVSNAHADGTLEGI